MFAGFHPQYGHLPGFQVDVLPSHSVTFCSSKSRQPHEFHKISTHRCGVCMNLTSDTLHDLQEAIVIWEETFFLLLCLSGI